MSTSDLPPRLRTLVASLDALGEVVSRDGALATLRNADIRWEDVAPFVTPMPQSYARRRIARTDAFELLVMTWLPGQGSVPHDHAGSICALRLVRGRVRETLYASAPDGLVDVARAGELNEGEVLVDSSEHVHSLINDVGAAETLVTLHVYAPPLPELRRFAPRPSGTEIPALFTRTSATSAPTVAIVGGGFSGTLVAAHLVRLATAARRPVHVTLHDRQAAFGEGPAYRTVDARHLLNVPASNMSAWPDRPTDFLDWARARDAAVAPTDFLPRRIYGEYVRSALASVAHDAPDGVTAEIRREEVSAIDPSAAGFVVRADGGAHVDASAVVIATGHRPPDDPLRRRWHGTRTRYVEDPWASLALSAIRADETVVLLGTGLTAVDVLLTVCKSPRTAPVIAISRRGLLPAQHSTTPKPGLDPREWLAPLLALPGGPTAHALVRALREATARAAAAGDDWRRVVDGLRPHTASIWRALAAPEAARFLRHARAFWEVRRHRMAPRVGAIADALVADGTFRPLAGRVVSADASTSGVTLEVRARGAAAHETLHADWVVNCTGPGFGEHAVPPALQSLIDDGVLEPDALGLGVRTDAEGRATTDGRARPNLVVVGTLRKPDLWESTAVPELRAQAAAAATAIAHHLGWS